MEVEEVTCSEFDKTFPVSNHVFNKGGFNDLNKGKIRDVKYLVFQQDNKRKIGIIGGIADGQFSSPFSAPFGGWCYTDKIELKEIENAYSVLELWASKNGIGRIKIVLPPFFYDQSILSLIFNAAARQGYAPQDVDLNFHFALNNFDGNYLDFMFYNARKNYNIAERSGLIFDKVTDTDSIRLAYDIIAQNRSQRGLPLKMSFENIEATIKVVCADFFIVRDAKNTPIASAMVFHVTNKIVQVVYWGHIYKFSGLKPINFLSYNLFEHYKDEGKKYVDIGPSTEHSVPNYGLIEFKQSLGCDVSPKITLHKTLAI